MTEYRTPAGTQNETHDEHRSCHRCGKPRERFDPRLQGRDPEQPPASSDGKAPKHCHRCTVALISGTDPLAKQSEGDLTSAPDARRCEECGLPLVRGKSKTCGVRCRVALWRRTSRTVA